MINAFAAPLEEPHAIKRARERYRLELTVFDLNRMQADCREGVSTKLREENSGAEIHMVQCAGVSMLAVYRRADDKIVTFLSRDNLGDILEAARNRAIQQLASHICSTDKTNGFCSPRDGQCTHPPSHWNSTCIKQAEQLMRAIEGVGCIVWVFDKKLPPIIDTAELRSWRDAKRGGA